MSDLPRAQPGRANPLESAGRINAILETTRAHQQTQAASPPPPPPHTFPHDQNTQIWVRNDSQASLQRFEVVGLDEPVFLPVDGNVETQSFYTDPIFSVKPPVPCRHRGRWAVLVQPLGPCEVGRAIVSGSVLTRIYIASDQVDTFIPTMTVWADLNIDTNECNEEAVVHANRRYGPFAFRGLTTEYNEGSAQVLWVGEDYVASGFANPCSGTMDVTCENVPVATCGQLGTTPSWMITRNGCDEGCSGNFWPLVPDNCTVGSIINNLPCYGQQRYELSLIRMGNIPNGTESTWLQDCGCLSYTCHYSCEDQGSGYQWYTLRDNCVEGCECVDLEVLEAIYPGTYPCDATSCPRTVTRHCGTQSTTTTSTTSTTSTTPPPCTGNCGWHGCIDGNVVWQLYLGDTDCEHTDDCGCSNVIYSVDAEAGIAYLHDCSGGLVASCGTSDDDVLVYVPCGESCTSTTTTSTSTSTTTSTSTSTTTTTTTSTSTSTTTTSTSTSTSTSTTSSTSTTTTTPSCDGDCSYSAIADGGCPSGFLWTFQSSNCAPDDETCKCTCYGSNSGCDLVDNCNGGAVVLPAATFPDNGTAPCRGE